MNYVIKIRAQVCGNGNASALDNMIYNPFYRGGGKIVYLHFRKIRRKGTDECPSYEAGTSGYEDF